ncbi:MAG: LmeA family phospholipid-binding protein, partial [Armatimonadota bacterium]
PVTLTVRQEELNALIRRQAPPDVRELTFYFGDGTVAGTGRVTWKGRTLHLTVRARPVVSGGQVALDVQEVRVGRLQAPAGIRQQVREELNRGVRELLSERTVHADSVEVRPGVMTIHGRVGGR